MKKGKWTYEKTPCECLPEDTEDLCFCRLWKVRDPDGRLMASYFYKRQAVMMVTKMNRMEDYRRAKIMNGKRKEISIEESLSSSTMRDEIYEEITSVSRYEIDRILNQAIKILVRDRESTKEREEIESGLKKILMDLEETKEECPVDERKAYELLISYVEKELKRG